MRPTVGGDWAVERWRGSAGEFHARPLPEPLHRAVWVLEVDRPALVLGSSQRDHVVDADAAAAAGVDVVRRRSGGGAVLLVPGEACWVDVLLPVGDALWHDDVGRAGWWLGEAWHEAFAVVDGAVSTTVHRGPMVHTPWSSLVCFAGIGPGEVLAAGGSKVVGVSQRRTRAGARFQCVFYRRWDPVVLPALLALDAADRAALTRALTGAVATVTESPDDVLAAFLLALPR